MTLSCSCDYDYEGDFSWYYSPPENYIEYTEKRRKSCCSCKKKVAKGDLCTRFSRWRPSLDEIEERIHGDTRWLSSWIMCEECSDIFFNLEALGFCLTIGGEYSMHDYLKEYQELSN